jgi:hypothetical protein
MAFSPPPFDLPLEYALDFHLQKNPDHVAITYPSGDSKILKSCTYRELVPAIHRAGRIILDDANFPASSRPTSRVVAIVIKTGTLKHCQLTAQTHVSL